MHAFQHEDDDLPVDVEETTEFKTFLQQNELSIAIGEVQREMISCEDFTLAHAAKLEKIKPGIILDSDRTYRFTNKDSIKNFSVAMEDLSRYRMFLMGGALIALLALIYKVLGIGDDGGYGGGGGGSGGGGSSGGKSYSKSGHKKAIADKDAELARMAAEIKELNDKVTASTRLTDAFNKNLGAARQLLKHTTMTDSDIESLLKNESAAKQYFRTKLEEDIRWNVWGSKLYRAFTMDGWRKMHGELADCLWTIRDNQGDHGTNGTRIKHLSDCFHRLYDWYHNEISHVKDVPFPTEPIKDNVGDIPAIKKFLKIQEDLTPFEVTQRFRQYIRELGKLDDLDVAVVKLKNNLDISDSETSFALLAERARGYIERFEKKTEFIKRHIIELNKIYDKSKISAERQSAFAQFQSQSENAIAVSGNIVAAQLRITTISTTSFKKEVKAAATFKTLADELHALNKRLDNV